MLRFNASSDTFTEHSRGPVSGFPIEKGIGYAIVPVATITNPTTIATY